ncbi:MAG: nitroreductase family protein [Tissierella sp.]|uniref:nitroreductase family protein n=1 Tax=Tissierella sp. TaxID=41274 RepID=UPI003F98CEB3
MLDLLMNRRTIRKYKDQEIEKETIDKILKGALTSPSGRNIKPWQVLVVNDKEVLAKLGKSRGKISAHMKDAGLGIVVIADPNLTNIWIEDASIMATVIQLTSQSLGLGSCWIQVRERLNENEESVEDCVKEILNIPNNYRVECMLAIGHPDEEKKVHSQESLSYDKVHYNSF